MISLEKFKISIALILISFGVFFGIKILTENIREDVIKSTTVVFGGASSIAATTTPIYAGLCIVAGAYLLAKAKAE